MLEMSKSVKANRCRSAKNAFKTPLQKASEVSTTVTSKWAGQVASSTKWVVSSLCERQLPIVVHNGLMDLMHLCDKFIGQVPDNIHDLGHMLEKACPSIFDTSTLEQDGRNDCDAPASLEDMHRRISTRCHHEGQVQVEQHGLFTYRFSAKENRLVFGRGAGAFARDAMCIAEAFLIDMDRRIHIDSLSRVKPGGKRCWMDVEKEDAEDNCVAKKVAKKSYAEHSRVIMSADISCEENQEVNKPKAEKPSHSSQGFLYPSFLKKHPLCVRFQNRIAAEGVVPCLHLRPQPPHGSKDVGANLHELLHKLGADVDENGKPVVTRAMAKHLRRALAQMRKQREVSDEK
jgi:hypothetical protein